MATDITLGLPLERRSAAIANSQLYGLLYVLGLLGTLLSIRHVDISDYQHRSAAITSIGFMLLSMIVLAAGIYFWIQKYRHLRCEHRRGEKLWLAGVHPEWLSPLPSYPKGRFSKQHYIFELQGAKWAYLGGSFATLIFAISVTNPAINCYHALKSYEHWPKASARILESSVKASQIVPMFSRSYRKLDVFDVEYTYEFKVNGESFRNSTSERFTQAGEAHWFLNNHRQKGQEIEIHYNPRSPNAQRINTKASEMEILTMTFPVGLLVISLCLLFFGVQAWRAAAVSRSQSRI